MRLDSQHTTTGPSRPVLRALEGGRKADRRTARDMAQVEYVALCAELEENASRIAMEAKRLVRKAQLAREEILALVGPDGGAA